MDLVLNVLDDHVFTPYLYPTSWKEDNMIRQIISLYMIVVFGGYFLYMSLATISYYMLFDHRLMKHPQFLKNQVQLEILYTCKSVPIMAIPTVSLFILEVRGYSYLYDTVDTPLGYIGILVSIITFITFTDAFIYWIHRFLHHKHVYKYLHKDHHKWKVTTPFASHAFHPLDGFLQSAPYHIYPFIFPLNKLLYLILFVFVNVWTVSIHDGNYAVPEKLKPFVNGSAHHTDHHLYYNYNYGQFFTLWDRIGGSFRNPSAFEGDGPMKAVEELEHNDKCNGTGKADAYDNASKKSD